MTPQSEAPKGLLVPAHTVPAPSTVSAQARAFVSQRMDPVGPAQPRDTKDKEGWRAYIEESNHWLTEGMKARAKDFPSEITTHRLPEARMYEITPEHLVHDREHCAILYIHGGAYIHGAGLAGAYMAMPTAASAGMRTYAVDYRMPPEHPFPAGLDDAVDAYRYLLERHEPARIAVSGGSAGGGLAAALVLKARDLGLPLPGACVLATPEADLTESGDSFETNIHVDVVASQRLTDSIALYADGHDLRDPYLSPVFADFGAGFPPTMLTCGTRDLFLSNTVLMHRALRRAGVEAELHVWEAMPHGGFFGAPEDQEVLDEHTRFVVERLTAAAPAR